MTLQGLGGGLLSESPFPVDGIADLLDLHVDPPEVDVAGADSPSSRNSTKLIKTSLLKDEGPLSQV